MGLTTAGRDQTADLRAAYTFIANYTAGNAEILDVAGALGSGTRLAREVVGVLVHAGMVEAVKNGQGFKAITKEEHFEEWLATPATAPEPKPESNQLKHPCRCGCGFNTNHPESRYLPGHDARHAGAVARALVEWDRRTSPGADAIAAYLTERLQTTALVDKAHALFLRWSDAPAPKRSRKAKAERTITTTGSVKKGRWTYPTQTWSDGVTERNTKRDGSGEWVKI